MNFIDRRFLNLSLSVLAVADQPAANPAVGTQYIVGANPSGDFANASQNQIARFDGSIWRFFTPKAGSLEVLNLDTNQILQFNGTAWSVVASLSGNSQSSQESQGAYSPILPVLAILPTATELPASCAVEDSILNTADAKIYSATAADTWNEGVATVNGARYASSSDFKIYSSDGSALSSENIPVGGIFLNKADSFLYVYDGEAFVKANDVSVPVFVTEHHSLTATEVSAKSFNLSHNIASGQESNTLLFVSGVAQTVGVDFSVSGNSISWNDKALDDISLIEGDSFLIQYIKE